MALPAITRLLGNASLGAVYYRVAPKSGHMQSRIKT